MVNPTPNRKSHGDTSTLNALTPDTLTAFSNQLQERMNQALFIKPLMHPEPEPQIFKPMDIPVNRPILGLNAPIYTKLPGTEIRVDELKALPTPKPKVDLSNYFNGYRIVEHDSCIIRTPVQVRFPKSRKKRIRKKWAKRPQNFSIDHEYKCYVLEPQRTMFVPPGYIAKIKKALEDELV